MSAEDHTRAVTVKRATKKTSGYRVTENNGEYFVSEAPAKARVASGDKVVRINGIKADEFVDEDDANDLIESIRIVVVPKDEIDAYEQAKAAEDAGGGAEDEEEYEEYDRRDRKPKAAAAAAAGGAGVAAGAAALGRNDKGENNVHHCPHCDHDNEDLSEDEDGDLVCESCGHVIEVPDGPVFSCAECGHENHNLERDEDGDYVCEECGAVIPEQNNIVASDKPDPKSVYVCPDCAHETINPEPDEEGDRICEECGCILPEKLICPCDECGRENVDPQPGEDGVYRCEDCGADLGLEVEEEEPEKSAAEKLKEMSDKAEGGGGGGGQEFGDDGKPKTNAEGKKLTPADMFKPGDIITVTVGKSNPKQDCGLKVEERNGKYYVRKVPSGGLFAKTPVIAGDKILELNGTDTHEFKDVNELKKILKDEERITIVVLRKDPDASESEASSVDFSNLAPITSDGGVAREEIQEKDDDTAGYDGEDCGCVWCPDCHG